MNQQPHGHQLPPGDQQHLSDMKRSHSPSSDSYAHGTDNSSAAAMGLGLDHQQQQQLEQQQQFDTMAHPVFDYNQNTNFLNPPGNLADTSHFDSSLSYDPDQTSYLSPDPNSSGELGLFPSPNGQQGGHFNAPLLDQSTLNPNDLSNMASTPSHHSPTPPHLLGSAPQSPSFSQHQFSSPPSHSRNVSLGPESALLPNQLAEWSQPQFQGHRRTPSEYSEVSSVSPSPIMVSSDTFDLDASHHSPMQQPSDSLYQEVLNIGNFTISDHSSQGRSPSHSPAISPRLMPQDLTDPMVMLPNQHMYAGSSDFTNLQQGSTDVFPSLHQNSSSHDVSQMAPPAINIDLAPSTGPGGFDNKAMDQASLTPPNRGRPKSRPRAVTDPFHQGATMVNRPISKRNSLSPSMSPEVPSRGGSSRSLSPRDRSPSAASRRRQSTSAVPNNVMALRLADPEHHSSQEVGSAKRVQKHPATFQCTLCPKRFTRAYNLRSHLRTHTDERPFVCTVCQKAFARQHDRKRHESLHSGEKKFVCKGDLKAGGQWGCGRRFARADALGRHFRSEAGRVCIKSLLDEEMLERQRQWQEQRMQENMQNLSAQQQPQSINMDTGYPMDSSGNYLLPAALLAQYPALAQMNWSAADMGGAGGGGGGLDEEYSGRSSFDASDYDEGDDGGYTSGPGTGFGEGGMSQNYGDLGYSSDIGGR